MNQTSCLTFFKLEIDRNVEEIEINLHNLSIEVQWSHFYNEMLQFRGYL